MSANAPSFTPGMPVPSSGPGGSGGSGSLGGASFEQESLRAVSRAPQPLHSVALAASLPLSQRSLPHPTERSSLPLLQAAEGLWAGTSLGGPSAGRPQPPAPAPPPQRFTVPDLNKVPSMGALEAESMRAAAAGLWGGGGAPAPAGADGDGLNGLLGGLNPLASLGLDSPGGNGG
jgi:hypothetical protein